LFTSHSSRRVDACFYICLFVFSRYFPSLVLFLPFLGRVFSFCVFLSFRRCHFFSPSRSFFRRPSHFSPADPSHLSLIVHSSFIHHHSSSPGVHPHRRIAFTRRRCPSRWPSGRPLRRLLMSTTRSFWKTDDDDDDDDDDMMTSVSRNNKRLLAKGFWFNRGRERGFKTRTTVTTSTLSYLVVVFVHQLMHALLFLLVLLPRHPRAKLTGLLLHALAPPRAKVAGAVARGVRGDVGVQHGVPAWRQLLQESKV
jgi:hypothetical protein